MRRTIVVATTVVMVLFLVGCSFLPANPNLKAPAAIATPYWTPTVVTDKLKIIYNTVEVEKVVKETVVVVETVEVVVTATPGPATSTPTYTPTATDVPATATWTAVPMNTLVTTAVVRSTAVKVIGTVIPMPVEPLTTTQKGGWRVELYEGATSQMEGWVQQLKDLVKDFSKFPNVEFTKYQFLPKDGVEYGMAESAYCQRSQTCDINVPAMHYRLVTGDYNIPGIDGCSFDENGAGCAIALFNVGEVTAMFRESTVDYGFTVAGRYWNGDAMPVTVWALASHTAYAMLNIGGTVVGVSLPVNPGANCSSPAGCKRVRLTFAIISGNELLMKGVTMVAK